jgi:hypothetical protein
MARVLNEKFEAAGYDEAGWTESVGAGSTVDEDIASSDAGSPSQWGSQCLKIIRAASTDAYTYKDVSFVDTWTRIEVVVAAEGLGNSTQLQIAWAYDATDVKNLYILKLAQSAGGVLWFLLNTYLDGSTITGYYATGISVSLNQRYRIEVKWDVTNNAFEWKMVD